MSFIGKVAADHLHQILGWRGIELPEGILAEVRQECRRQVEKWGVQDHPDGTGRTMDQHLAEVARELCEASFKEYGTGTWRHILLEEVYEALAESDPAKLREELVQVAAVAASWIADIDRRTARE